MRLAPAQLQREAEGFGFVGERQPLLLGSGDRFFGAPETGADRLQAFVVRPGGDEIDERGASRRSVAMAS